MLRSTNSSTCGALIGRAAAVVDRIVTEKSTSIFNEDHSDSDDRLTVALVISNLEYGGAERQTVELANRLHAFDCTTHLISLSHYIPLADNLNRDVAKLHIVERRSKFDISVMFRLARLLRRIQADVVHGFLFDAEIFSRLAGKLAGTTAIVGSERNSETIPPLKKKIPYQLTSSLVDICIANSDAGARDNARIYRRSLANYRIIRNGVDIERFQPGDATDIRSEFGLAANDFVVAIFGSFKPQKNHGMFVDAARLFIESGRQAKFLFVGDVLQEDRRGSGDYSRSIMKKVKNADIEQHCIFTGNRLDVEKIYRACDIVSLTSLHEGTPNVALEALASGVPVIATDVSDNRRILGEGESSFIVALNDDQELARRLAELYDNRDLLETMSISARDRAIREFSLERLADETATCYREIVQVKRDSV